MIVRVKIQNLRELFRVAGGSIGDLAVSLEVSRPTASRKLDSIMFWYEDELDTLVDAINEPGVVTVDRETLVKLIGAREIKVRGTLADKRKAGAK